MKIHDNLSLPAKQAADSITNYLKNQDDVLLLVAGGSSLSVLDYTDTDITANTNLTVGVLDERFSTEDKYNNYSQLIATDWGQSIKDLESVELINTNVTNTDSLSGVTERFRSKLMQWKNDHPEGAVIALVGVGEDGHIAGMIPTADPDQFQKRFCGQDFVVGYDDSSIDNQFNRRITVTMQFFRYRLDKAFVFAAGKRKCAVLCQLRYESPDLSRCPAQILKTVPSELFTDCNLEKD
jgi:6-phosphogluconolactonase/glucosamine-6-phosphate isomerase/deaminase